MQTNSISSSNEASPRAISFASVATTLGPREICSVAVAPSGSPCAGVARPWIVCTPKVNRNFNDSRPLCPMRFFSDVAVRSMLGVLLLIFCGAKECVSVSTSESSPRGTPDVKTPPPHSPRLCRNKTLAGMRAVSSKQEGEPK